MIPYVNFILFFIAIRIRIFYGIVIFFDSIYYIVLYTTICKANICDSGIIFLNKANNGLHIAFANFFISWQIETIHMAYNGKVKVVQFTPFYRNQIIICRTVFLIFRENGIGKFFTVFKYGKVDCWFRHPHANIN